MRKKLFIIFILVNFFSFVFCADITARVVSFSPSLVEEAMWEEAVCLTPNINQNNGAVSIYSNWATFTPNRNVYAVWCRASLNYPVIMRWWNQDDFWSSEETVSVCPGMPNFIYNCFASVSGDSNNNVHFIWQGYWDYQYYRGLFYRAKLVNNIWTNICSLPLGNIGKYPKIAGGKGDTAHCVYCGVTSNSSQIIYEKIYPEYPNPRVIEVDTIFATDSPSVNTFPHIAVDGQNRIHIVWQANIVIGNSFTNIFYRMRDANGVWGAIETVSVMFEDNYSNFYPRLAVDGAGNVHIVWNVVTFEGAVHYLAHRMKTSLGWSNISLISSTYTYLYPTCAVDKFNNLHIVLQSDEGGSYYNIVYLIRRTNGNWEPPQYITKFDDNGYRCYPEIVITSDNNFHLFRVDNASYTNNYNWIYYQRFLNIKRDAGVKRIIQPKGNIPKLSIAPQIVVKNYGLYTLSFPAYLRIYDENNNLVYNSAQMIPNLAPKRETVITFTSWTPESVGNFLAIGIVNCELDENRSNDTLKEPFFVYWKDVGISQIIQPVGEYPPLTRIEPKCKIKNFGNLEMFDILVKCSIPNLNYLSQVSLEYLAPYEEKELSFDTMVITSGSHQIYFIALAEGDLNPHNNILSNIYSGGNAGWQKMANVTGATKPVKGGGCLCSWGDKIYALIGNNTSDLMVYDIKTNSWSKMGEVPKKPPKRKNIKKGAAICTDGRYLYILKGNNTQEFWRYDLVNNTWKDYQVEFSQGIKGGSMAWDGDSFIYIICGSSNNEWKRFNRYTEKFEDCVPAELPGNKWKYGSWIVYVPDGKIYGLRVGGKINEFYKITIGAGATPVSEMPLFGSSGRKKKAKEGSGGAYNPNDRLIYALKGGNTLEFFSYNPQTDEWKSLEDLGTPSVKPAKKVKGGGALTYSPAAGGLFAFVGNGTYEFWLYLPQPSNYSQKINFSTRETETTANDPKTFDFSVKPDIYNKYIKISYSTPTKLPTVMSIYNSMGQLVYYLKEIKSGLIINTQKFSPGIYIIKLNAGGFTKTEKIVIH